jgi:anti-sigma factor RsiW
MKCLSRIELQEYIDGEVTPATGAEINIHLESCNMCMNLYKKAFNDKEFINRMLNEAGSEVAEIPVPEFIPPEEKSSKKIYLRVIEILAAASIIGLIFLFQKTKTSAFEKIPQAEILLYEFYDGKDLNKMWHEKSQIIILQDEKGNVIQSIITN